MEPTAPRSVPADPDFLGRDDELRAALGQLRPGARVVLVGPGGAGKTTLARRVAAGWAGPVVFADLSAARTADEAWLGLAAALELPHDGGLPLAERVVLALDARPGLLLVLDNLEQVARPDAWLAGLALPDGAALITTRVRPGAPGEVLVPVGPLGAAPAVALLRRRAGRADAGDDATLQALADALDRLPLALELAGARLRFLAASELLAGLGARLDLLSSGDGGRHGTLRAAIEWSWELLTPRAREALVSLSVFEAAFPREAAAAVLGEPPLAALGVVEGLCDHSLARVEPGPEPRFALYEAVRAWARELLAVDPEAPAPARHRRWVAGALEAVGRDLDAGWSAPAVERRGRLLPDALVAVRAAVAGEPDEAAAVDAARILARLPLPELWPRVPAAELATLADAVVARLVGPGAPRAPDALARALLFRAGVRGETPRRAGAEHDARAALGWAVTLGDRALEGRAHAQLGHLAVLSGQARAAEADFEAAVAAAREVGEAGPVASALTSLGSVRFALGRLPEAEEAWREALALLEDGGEAGAIGRVHVNLGNLHLARGRPALARDHHARAEARLQAAGDRVSLARLLGNRAATAVDAGDRAEALALGGRALELCRRLALRRSEGIVRLTLGLAHEDHGELASALEQVLVARRAVQEARDARFVAWAEAAVGRLYALQGDPEPARSALSRALDGATAAGDRPLARRCAVCLRALGEPDAPPEGPADDPALGAVERALDAGDPVALSAAVAALAAAPSAEARVVARLVAAVRGLAAS